MVESKVLFGMTPLSFQTISPFLNRINVGTPRILNLVETEGFLSTSILRIRTEDPSFFLTASTIGVIVLHGPHHVAWKSTSVGISELIIS